MFCAFFVLEWCNSTQLTNLILVESNYQLRKKAREAKEAPSRHDGVADDSKNGGGCTNSDKGSIPAVTANASMDSTVDLSYSSDTMDTTGCTSTSAASADAAVKEDDAKAAVSAAEKQQQRRRQIAAATATIPSGGARTSTHIHVTTSSAFTRTGDWQRQRSAVPAAAAVSTLGAQAQHKQQECKGGKRLICLISNGVADRTQAHRQLHALNILQVRRTPYEVVDGMDPAQRHIRDELFRISGVRGNYPQFFLERQIDNGYGGTIRSVEFWGNYDTFENLNEVDSLPPDVLLANPEVETWDNVFGDCY